jgi:PadR family transcriptional regulator, regulatory protein PadR
VRASYENGLIFLRGNVKDLTSSDRAVHIASTAGKVVNLLHVDVSISVDRVVQAGPGAHGGAWEVIFGWMPRSMRIPVAFQNVMWDIRVGNQEVLMPEKSDVPQGTLALMVLKTLDLLGPLHGYGIARRIEQISGDLLAVNQGTLYPLLLKLEQEGAITSEWGASDNNRRARFYQLTKAGQRQLRAETGDWERTAAIIARFFAVKAEDL